MAGSASVRRSASASAAPAAISARRGEPLPVACRQIFRNSSPTFTRTFPFPPHKNKKAQPRKGPCLVKTVVSDQLSAISYPLTDRDVLPL
jgi:hypothetical protein